MRARIDGRRVAFEPGETILEAASRLGVRIPALCHREGLRPEGGCRLCLVEVESAPRPLGACHTPLAEGMRVETATPKLEALRREILELWVASLPEGAFAARDSGNELEALMARYGVGAALRSRDAGERERDESHPYLRFERALCIDCRRCLRACEDIQGQLVYGVEGRGSEARLIFGSRDRFLDSACTACGACVDHCPTGAVTDRDRLDRARPDAVTRSTCGYCGVGCAVEIEASRERVLRIRGVPEAAVNRGHLCAKGRHAHAYQSARDRLTRPLLRDGEQWQPVSWQEAIRWLAERLTAIRDAHGPDALGVFTSSRSTNESAYLLQKLFRTAIGTNNVDCCARVCHSSTALALREATGTGAASASYADIERAGLIVVAGANATEAHPVLGARIKQVARRGAALVVIDPRRIELVEHADLHLQLRPGTNVALFNAVARVLVDEQWTDADYVRERTEGLAELTEFLSSLSLERAAAICALDVEAIRCFARMLERCGPGLFVHGLGLSELTQGTASVLALCNLAMLTGSIGGPGAGMLPLRGQNNVQGNADMGGMPNLLTGYQPLDQPEVRRRVERVWGALPPTEPGKTIPEMIDAAARRQIRGLWIQGEDVAQSDPNQTHVIEALERLDLLVVQELFFSETARYAHLILPAAGALEQDGTFTNGERRIQRVRRAVPPPGEARPDWEAVRDLGNALRQHWGYAHPGEVMQEIARVAPRLFGGVSYARLEGDGLQWPCPRPDHPGTATVHADGFLRGRGRLAALEYAPSAEHPSAAFPYVLVTGRVLQQYNVGTMTRRTPNRELAPEDFLEIHPEDAEREGLESGRVAVVESRWGDCRARVRVAPRVAPGTLFLSFHYPETHANRLTGPQVDPRSKCPEYKVTAVRVSRAAATRPSAAGG